MWTRRMVTVLALLSLAVAGCETPAEVKQLSLKQMQYFDSAIEAVSLESEALLLAAGKLADQAKDNIALQERTNLDRCKELAAKTIPTLPDEKKAETANLMVEDVAKTVADAQAARAQLDQDLALIEAKTEELKAYLAKMKEVHQALDAYIQSEKAGERVLNDLLHQPSVNALLVSADELISKVRSGMQQVQTVLNGMPGRT